MTKTDKPTVKQKGVIFLEKNRLQIYIADKPNILVFDIPPAISHDIEIFNKAEFSKLLSAFLKTNAASTADFILILAQNVLFEKDFTPANPEEQKKFITTVPFEYVSDREYPHEKGVRVVAANSDFYNSIQEVLEQNGSAVAAVVPYFILSPQLNGLEPGIIGTVLSQFNQLKQQSFTKTQETEFTIIPEDEKSKKSKKGPGKEVFALLGVFVMLIGVLSYMIFKPSPKPNVSAAPVPTTAPVVVTPSAPVPTAGAGATQPVPANGPEAAEKEKVVFQVTYDTSQAQQAQAVKDALQKADYKNVTLTDGGTISAPQPLITLSLALSTELKADITSIVKTILSTASSQENNESASTVAITIGK